MAVRDAIKLELPMGVKTFKFTFECRTPGPIASPLTLKYLSASLSGRQAHLFINSVPRDEWCVCRGPLKYSSCCGKSLLGKLSGDGP
ncbi:hypothetical protein BDR07DRAFT_1463419, partial [Suillus spraguei]